jgi:branched-chain amino acid transport system substrate-binding protein
MRGIRKLYGALVVGVGLAFGSPASAEEPIKIGLLTDMSSVLSSASGQGSVTAAEMAIEDYGGELLGRKIELISADHQNKGDIGSSIARKWLYEEDVKLFMDIASSVVALALRELVQENNVSMIYGSASSAVLTNQSCSPNTVSWGHDSYQLTRVVSDALL